MSEKSQLLCIRPLNPRHFPQVGEPVHVSGFSKLGTLSSETPKIGGLGGLVQRCLVLFRHPLKPIALDFLHSPPSFGKLRGAVSRLFLGRSRNLYLKMSLPNQPPDLVFGPASRC